MSVQLVIMSDASNKPDSHSGLAQAGHTAHWTNGPVSSKGSLLKHDGLSSEHNEYMGLTAALRFAVWTRQLLDEMAAVTYTVTMYRQIICARTILCLLTTGTSTCHSIGTDVQYVRDMLQ